MEKTTLEDNVIRAALDGDPDGLSEAVEALRMERIKQIGEVDLADARAAYAERMKWQRKTADIVSRIAESSGADTAQVWNMVRHGT